MKNITISFNDISIDIFRYIMIIISIILIGFIAKVISSKIIAKLINNKIKNEKYRWYEFARRRKVFKRTSYIIMALVIYQFVFLFKPYDNIINTVFMIFFFAYGALIIDSTLSSINDLNEALPLDKRKPIKGGIQVLKIITYIIFIISFIAYLLKIDTLAIIGGIGAFTAILTLVFKDTITGFVSGLQIIYNDLMKIGDFIEMPSHNVLGTVVDISLHNVKIKNLNNSVTYVPTHLFMIDAFKNYRYIKESGLRFIQKSFTINANSIKIINSNIKNKLKENKHIKEYLNKKDITNIELLRIYIQAYLRENDNISKDNTIMIKELGHTQLGLPIEIRAYSNIVDLIEFEKFQAQILDHIYGILPSFDLSLSQIKSDNIERNM